MDQDIQISMSLKDFKDLGYELPKKDLKLEPPAKMMFKRINHIEYEIKSTLHGITKEQQKSLMSRADQVIQIYDANKHDRINFMPYTYLLHKLCLLENLDEFIDYLPLSKNKIKLTNLDKMWKSICSELRWKFTRS
jgi:hypothetical protein